MSHSRELVLITPDKVNKIRQEVKDSLVRCWRKCSPISPRMSLAFHVYSEEVYTSDVGNLRILTPVWRGRTFTDAVVMHELLRWSIYPKDNHRALKDILSVRTMLAKESSFTPKKKRKLLDEEYDWTGFEYTFEELLLVEDVLGRYLVNMHLYHNYHHLWSEIWHYLYRYGAFYGRNRPLKRDYVFLLYLSAYTRLIPGLQELTLNCTEIEENSEKIANIVGKTLKGKITNVFALKELAKIFHKYIQAETEERREKGLGVDYKRPPKCPKCGNEEFEIVAYEDAETGIWINVKEGAR